jgi:hypothetical protein
MKHINIVRTVTTAPAHDIVGPLRAFRHARHWQAFHRFNEYGCVGGVLFVGIDRPPAINIAKRLPVCRIKRGSNIRTEIFARRLKSHSLCRRLRRG